MIVLGIIFILLGIFVASIKFLLWLGIVVLIVGRVLNLVPIGGSAARHRPLQQTQAKWRSTAWGRILKAECCPDWSGG